MSGTAPNAPSGLKVQIGYLLDDLVGTRHRRLCDRWHRT
jgi:hypothetical protein